MNRMGGGKSKVWVPVNEKLVEKLEEAEMWSKEETLQGWLVDGSRAQWVRVL